MLCVGYRGAVFGVERIADGGQGRLLAMPALRPDLEKECSLQDLYVEMKERKLMLVAQRQRGNCELDLSKNIPLRHWA